MWDQFGQTLVDSFGEITSASTDRLANAIAGNTPQVQAQVQSGNIMFYLLLAFIVYKFVK